MSTPSEQRRPSLLFAAVNLLLASDPGSALADPYLRWLALARHKTDHFQWMSASASVN
jgi:hypothetical protein